MSKIAILSSYPLVMDKLNFGSLFQYYALQEYLIKLGHEPFWIRYYQLPTKISIYLKMVKAKKEYLKKDTIFFRKKTWKKCFIAFIHKYLYLSNNIYYSHKFLKFFPPKADIYITGSDKVWSDNFPYYLDFVPENKRRYSYAASFPRNFFKFSPTAALLLKKFTGVSVRENEGVDMCQKAGYLDAIQVLDPTMLLPKSHYLSLIKAENKLTNNLKGPYLFCYFGNVDSPSEVHWQSICSFAEKKSLSLILVAMLGIVPMFPEEYIYMPSPIEWLQLMSEADCIITNSFHGTIFSVIMEKPFLSIIPKDKPSVPISSFLDSLDLKSRIIQNESIDIEKNIFNPIDWEKVNARKKPLIQRSEEYLYSI